MKLVWHTLQEQSTQLCAFKLNFCQNEKHNFPTKNITDNLAKRKEQTLVYYCQM